MMRSLSLLSSIWILLSFLAHYYYIAICWCIEIQQKLGSLFYLALSTSDVRFFGFEEFPIEYRSTHAMLQQFYHR